MRWMSDYYVVIGAVAVGVCLVAIAFFWLRSRALHRARAAVTLPAEPPQPPALQYSLTLTRRGLLVRLRDAWGAGKDTEARLAELEEVLLAADIGPKATQQLLAKLRPLARELADVDALRGALRKEMRTILEDGAAPSDTPLPYVILVAGVNGVGKPRRSGSSPITTGRAAVKCCWWRRIPSVLRQGNNSSTGPGVSARPASGTKAGPTPRPWRSMVLKPLSRVASTWSLSIPPAGCTSRRI